MPERQTLERARKLKKEGKPATTQAGAFVREEMHHMQEGKHPVRSRRQAVAIGLSKARRSGVKLPARGKASGARKKTASTTTRKSTTKKGTTGTRAPTRKTRAKRTSKKA